jgi:hypothetical protein
VPKLSIRGAIPPPYTFSWRGASLSKGYIFMQWYLDKHRENVSFILPYLWNFLFTTASRLALGPTQSPIQWVSGAVSPESKQPGRESGHSLPSRIQVNVWSYVSVHPYVSVAWCVINQNISLWRGAWSAGSTLPSLYSNLVAVMQKILGTFFLVLSFWHLCYSSHLWTVF